MVSNTTKKKILIVGPAHPLRGGIAASSERIASEFIGLGHQCDMHSFSLQYPSFLFPGKTQFTDDAPPENLKITSNINSINPLNWIKVGLQLKKQKYDLVIFRYWMSFMAPCFGTIARIIKQNKHTQIVSLTDNAIPHEPKFFDKPFSGFFFSVCDVFLTMSESVKQDLLDMGIKVPINYVPHPLYDTYGSALTKQDARAKLNLKNTDKYLLFFGFIRKYKGLSLLIEALAKPKLKELNIKLIVAGEFYEDKEIYINQITQLGLSNEVILHNEFIPTNQVSTYFCACDVVVQPYLNATQSGVTQIAYYYNKPMIVTNVGGLAELVPNNKVGFVCNVNSDEIADAIHTFYTQNKEPEFTLGVIKEKERFSWTTLCKSLLTLNK